MCQILPNWHGMGTGWSQPDPGVKRSASSGRGTKKRTRAGLYLTLANSPNFLSCVYCINLYEPSTGHNGIQQKMCNENLFGNRISTSMDCRSVGLIYSDWFISEKKIRWLIMSGNKNTQLSYSDSHDQKFSVYLHGFLHQSKI